MIVKVERERGREREREGEGYVGGSEDTWAAVSIRGRK